MAPSHGVADDVEMYPGVHARRAPCNYHTALAADTRIVRSRLSVTRI